MSRRQLRADLAAACDNVNRLSRAISTAWEQRDEARDQVEVLVAAAEFDRQQRLAAAKERQENLVTLLAAEAKVARVQEERDALSQQLALIKRVGWAGPGYALVRIDVNDRPWAASTATPDLWPAVHTSWAEMAITHPEKGERP